MKIYGDRIAGCGDLELDFVYYPQGTAKCQQRSMLALFHSPLGGYADVQTVNVNQSVSHTA